MHALMQATQYATTTIIVLISATHTAKGGEWCKVPLDSEHHLRRKQFHCIRYTYAVMKHKRRCQHTADIMLLVWDNESHCTATETAQSAEVEVQTSDRTLCTGKQRGQTLTSQSKQAVDACKYPKP
jgi:hypothetical protein